MGKPKTCPDCGAKMVEYTFSFNVGLATFLIQLYRAHRAIPTHELDLEYSQRTNSQKLRYWGLAKSESRGVWQITFDGKSFVESQTLIHERVVMYRNEFVRFEGDLIRIGDVVRGYQTYADFVKQIQAKNQGVLF